VLLVDDDRVRRYSLAQLLRSDGCEVHSAAGHESWLSFFSSTLSEPAVWVSFAATVDPDLVLLEIEQPSALATLSALRRHPLTEHLPIVVLGDPVQGRSLQAARGLGAERILMRPFELGGLRDLVSLVLAEAPPRPPRTGDERHELVVH